MKKYLSVLRIFCRSTFLWNILLLAAMAAGELILFHIAINSPFFEGSTFEDLVEQSRIFGAFGIAFCVMTVLLCLPGCEFSSKTGYTLRRLSVKEKTVFWLQSGHNLLWYLLLWGAQFSLLLLCWKEYAQAADPSVVGGQNLFLAFYRSELLHALIPMENLSVWVRNGFFLLGLSLCSAQFPFTQRREQKLFFIVPMVILVLLMYPRKISEAEKDVIAMMFTLSFTAFALGRIYKKEDSYEE